MKKIRIDRFLANIGIGSRKTVKKILKEKRVSVNGNVISDPSFKVDPEFDTVSIDGNLITYKKNHYYMLNKPSGYVTSTYDKEKPYIMELFHHIPFYEKLFPAGRLDIDTEGLLIITDDGVFAHRITHPKWKVEKEYYAVVKGDVSDVNTHIFEREGIKLNNYRTKPFKIKVISSSEEKSEILITVREGKYHIVKRIMEKIGHPVLYLKRVRIGSLKLDENLKLGEFRELTDGEINSLKKLIKL